MAISEQSALTHYISQRDGYQFLARTADGQRLVSVSCSLGDLRSASDADVLVLRYDSDRVIAARYSGESWVVGADGDEALELVGMFRVDPDGTVLASFLDIDDQRPDESSRGHDWGALGLPNGVDTRVLPVREQDAADEVAMAMASEGYRHYASRRAISLSPGDRISAGAVSGMVIDLDRRTREIEMRSDDGETQMIRFDAVADLEQHT